MADNRLGLSTKTLVKKPNPQTNEKIRKAIASMKVTLENAQRNLGTMPKKSRKGKNLDKH